MHGYRAPLAQFGEYLVTLAVRKANVEDDQVRRLGGGQCQAFGSVGRQQHLVAFGAQADIEESTNLHLVVDHQHARRGRIQGVVSGGVGKGSTMRMVVPPPSRGKASMLAAMGTDHAAADRQPRPVPWWPRSPRDTE